MIDDLGRVDLFVTQFQRPIGEELDILCGARNHAPEIAHQQRAVVDSLDRRELLGVIANRLRELFQNGMAAFGTERRPGWKCATRGSHGCIDFRRTARAHVGEVFAVDGRAVCKGSLRCYALAVDEVIGRDVH